MCDVLPRLHNVLARLTPDVHVILSPYVNGWQKRSLELLGLPKNRWFFHSGKRPLKVERLLYASPVAMTGDHEVNSLNWVRDTIWQSCLGGLPSVVGKRKLYLTRKGTWSRSVANESEFLPALLERGFQIVDCGALTFEEQVRLFSEAVVVVGPHGAALTNILWSPPGIKVFEIFEPVAVRRCYWSMCRTLGHKHYCGIGQSITQSNQEPNIYVPLEEFKRALEIIDIG
jgi:capsular polysaccharide biosynthesis protein